jgi:hypothetical protein
MSILLTLTSEVTTHAATVGHTLSAAVPRAAGGGIIDWLTGKNAAVQTLSRAFSITAGIIFVIYQAIVSRGAMARVIIAGIAAGIFIWIVFNVTDLQTRVNNEVNASQAPAGYSQLAEPSAHQHPVGVSWT